MVKWIQSCPQRLRCIWYSLCFSSLVIIFLFSKLPYCTPSKFEIFMFSFVSLQFLLLFLVLLPPLSPSFFFYLICYFKYFILNLAWSLCFSYQMHHCQEDLAIIDWADSDFEELPLAVNTFIDRLRVPLDCGTLYTRRGMAKCT